MTPTQIARRSDALYSGTTKRDISYMVAYRESDLEDARAENAKLRELMSELWPIACSGSCVDKCAHYDECLPHYEEDGCMLKARMRELGVEVTS
jgi:hypothetical protein